MANQKGTTLEKILPEIRKGKIFSNNIYYQDVLQPLKEGQKKADTESVLVSKMKMTEGFEKGTTSFVQMQRGNNSLNGWNFGSVTTDVLLGNGWFIVED